MTEIQTDISRRLLYVLHRGLVETRNLALATGNEQIAELTDALELLPRMIDEWKDVDLDMVRYVLRNYQDKYPDSAYDYVASLDESPPDRF